LCERETLVPDAALKDGNDKKIKISCTGLNME
jgi:hypothetical protein